MTVKERLDLFDLANSYMGDPRLRKGQSYMVALFILMLHYVKMPPDQMRTLFTMISKLHGAVKR